MIRLLELLESPSKSKKAIIFAGPVAAGKSTIIKNYIPAGFEKYILNTDNYLEKEMGTKIDQGQYDHDMLSKYAKVLNASIKQIRLDLIASIKKGVPIIIDATGGSIKKTVEKKEALENAGYDVMMVMVYTSPLATLSRNANRDRKLKPSIVLRNWKDVVSNIRHYMNVFDEKNFSVVDNNAENDPRSFSADEAERYFKSNLNYRELSPEEKQTMEREINKLVQDSESLPFVAFDELDTKIKNFLIPQNGPEQ